MPSIAKLDQLLSLENINDCVIQIDDFISKLCEFGDRIERLTEAQKNFFYNQSLEKEVNNGGFGQYFMNSSGEYAHETIQSLITIGANKTAAILQQAINEFPGAKVPKERHIRLEALERIEDSADEVWDSLDQQFYEYEDDLNSLNIEYIKRNKDLF